MLPRSTFTNGIDTTMSNTVTLTDSIIAQAFCNQESHYANLICRQFGRSTSFTSIIRRCPAVALHPILHVVGLCTCVQMVRPHAERIVAMVQNRQPIRNGAVMEFVRDAVSANLASISIHSTVTVAGDITNPHPTSLGFTNALPKTRCNRQCRSSHNSPIRLQTEGIIT